MKLPRKCETCKGRGEVPATHSRAADRGGRFSMSGEAIADAAHSLCIDCQGCGMER